ncbi:hypothetical protein Y032_0009g561 [Ancylostoma ceylanicum]|uniref:NTR domain-containing protein n=1 Tax=Ancylostoma ceylanicum TaxID=53326 RepID=A0A016VHU1_9BILA|nr:hypothetical protein Y032_0009g561 [Ancylostoma ceylanicum]
MCVPLSKHILAVTHAVVKTVNQLNDRFLNYTVEHKRIYKVSSLLQLLPKSNPSNNNNLPTTIIALGEGNPCGVKLELKKHYLLGGALDWYGVAGISSCSIVKLWKNVTRTQKQELSNFTCN